MEKFLFSNVEQFRYERKFYLEKLTREKIETTLKFHPSIFREIHHERTVNNIYFDSFNLQNYFDNLSGVNRRLKVRIRWYGNLFGFIEKPMLEFKLRHNLNIGKIVYPLKSFTLDSSFSIDIIRKTFKESSLNEALGLYLMELNFSLLNNYRRKYFLSADKKFRITIDTDMQVHKISPYRNSFLCKSTNYNDTILELKYNKSQSDFADNITSYFPFRVTKSSKYVDGIAKLYT